MGRRKGSPNLPNLQSDGIVFAKLCPTCHQYFTYSYPRKFCPLCSPRKQSVCAQAIVDYRLKNPCLTLQAIGTNFGISKERVRQILAKEGVRTTSANFGRTTVCPICGDRKSANSRFCPKCAHEQRTVTLICSWCGFTFPRPQQIFMKGIIHHDQELFFCCRNHQGKYIAARYGFVSRSEHTLQKSDPEAFARFLAQRRRKGLEARHNHAVIRHVNIRWMRRLGFTYGEIGEYLKCAPQTVYRALTKPVQ